MVFLVLLLVLFVFLFLVDAMASIQFLPVAFPVSFAAVHIQVCTSGKNKLRRAESKPVKQLGKFSLVKRCYSTIGFAVRYCIGPMGIREKMEFNFDRLRHAQTIGWCLLLCCMPLKQAMTKNNNIFD